MPPPLPPPNGRNGGPKSTGNSTNFGISPDSQAQRAIQSSFQNQFRRAASNEAAFHNLMRESFGANYDKAAADSFRRRALNGDFSWLPRMEFRSNETLQGGKGAYDASRNVIYLNENLKNDPALAAKVFAEETGHFLDARLNKADTPGDEGEMFQRLLHGEKLSAADKSAIRSENDHGVITVDGKKTEVEFSLWSRIKKAAKGVAKGVGKVAKGVGKVAKGIGKVAKGIAKGVGKVAKGVGKVAKGIAKGVKTVAKGIGKGLKAVGKGIAKAVKWFAPRAWEALKRVVGTPFAVAKNAIRNVGEALGTIFKGFGKILTGKFGEGFKELGKGLLKIPQTAVDAFLMTAARGISAIQTLVGLQKPERKLTASEIGEIRKVYGDSIDYNKVRVVEGGGLLSAGAARTVGNTIYIPKGKSPVSTSLLMHEMGHVWQYQNGGSDYMSEALASQAVGDGYEYNKGLDEGKSWSALNPEQQADLMRDAYDSGYFNPTSPSFGRFVSPKNGTDYTRQLEEALRQARAGKGAT